MPGGSRARVFQDICRLVGPVAEIVDASNGWPGTLQLQTASGPLRVRAYVGPASLHRPPGEDEYRLQPPGPRRPVAEEPGATTVALALWTLDGPAVIVGCEYARWLNPDTRTSAVFRLRAIRQAQASGWYEHVNSDGEPFYAFLPFLLPLYVEAVVAGIAPSDVRIVDAIAASGALDEGTETARERARRATSRLMRSAIFSRNVRDAFENRCCMCGLGLGLVSAAHIYPVAAAGSSDETWNGLCLCENHHRAFDAHKILVVEDTLEIKLHPDWNLTALPPDDRRFLASTRPSLLVPATAAHPRRAEMLGRRNAYFQEKYEWGL